MNRTIQISLLIVSILFNSCLSQPKKQEQTEKDWLEVFEQVWNTVNDQFYDPDFSGVDWNKKYSEYKPNLHNS